MDSIVERRSIRKYKDTEVSKGQIREIVEAAVKAPSAKNRQPWKFIAYSGETKNECLNTIEAGLHKVSGALQLPLHFERLLSDTYNTLKIMRQAPALIAVVNTNGRSPFENITTDRRITEICDTLSIGAAVENMILKATEIGLGTLWIANTFYAYEELSDFIGEDGQLACAVALGYADETPNPRPRKPFEDILEFRD